METQGNNKTASEIWQGHARRVARQINAAWWLQTLSGPLVIAALAGSCALLMTRRMQRPPETWELAAGAGGLVAIVFAASWLAARRKFEQPEHALVRIEAAMKLRNGLSAAVAGIAPWPQPPPKVDGGVSWNWERVAIPPVVAISLLVAGLLIPIAAANRSLAGAGPEKPQAWQQIEADLERLDQDKDVLDQSFMEQEKEQLKELEARDSQEWFSHDSLEATDTLKQQHQSEVSKLDRELERAGKAIDSLQQNAADMSPAQKDALLNQFDQAVKNLENGSLKPNTKLMEQLKGLNPAAAAAGMAGMDPDKLQQLKDNMKKAAQAAKDCKNGSQQGDGKSPGQDGNSDWNNELNDGQGNGEDGDKDGKNGKGKGGPGDGQKEGDGSDQNDDSDSENPNGAPDHGPGSHNSHILGKEHDKTKTGDLTGIDSRDLSNALPGDLLDLQRGAHQVDKTAKGPQAGGEADAKGAGGDRVWKESLDPSEQKALKKFFE